MNLVRTVELMERYATCPECGNDCIGGGAGELKIDDETFIRVCTCGWRVEVKDEQ